MALNVDWTPLLSLAGKPAQGSSLLTISGLSSIICSHWTAQSQSFFNWLNPKIRHLAPMADLWDLVREYLEIVEVQEYSE